VVDLPAALRSHTRIGLDTPVFIYHIQESSPFSSAASLVLEQLTQRSVSGVTSVLTLTELLVRPYQMGRRGLAIHYEALVRAIPSLAVVDTDARIARQAAVLRATHRLRTADAVQVASSLEHGATAFVTNDVRLRRISEIPVIVLADHLDG
jgi:predicted nucleic acid-binding protein